MPKKKRSPEGSENPGQTETPTTDWNTKTQDFLKAEPAKATGLALLGGLVLAVLPIGALIGLIVRLVFSLVRPALLIFGAVKLFEEFEKRKNS